MEAYEGDGQFQTLSDPLGNKQAGFTFNSLLEKTTDVLADWARSSFERQTIKDNGGTAVPSSKPASVNWKLIGGIAAGVLVLVLLLRR